MEKKVKGEYQVDELKNEYNLLSKKYSLPDFTALNELFDVEDTSLDTEFLLRNMRRTMIEKISGYLRFVELLLNPASTPAFFYKKIKKLENGEKENISKIYEIFGDIETESLLLDLEYAEKNEAEFIKEVFKRFDTEIKKGLIAIIKKLINGTSTEIKNNRGSYFG